ncbi:hypothetical protein [Shewanella pealeana]|uniref:hypothetical protein n=1 Tax=Shewanella pealeana TaxID=70864 RepID=UPI0002D82B3F|nr:hypothetical protein [Shewanella pealeana]
MIFDNNGVPEQTYTYTYNSFGNIESETQDKDGDGAADKITIYTHEPSNFRAVLYEVF